MRLLGMPLGASPMSPLGWAPTGLKYRSSTTDHSGSAFAASRRTCSHMYLVQP